MQGSTNKGSATPGQPFFLLQFSTTFRASKSELCLSRKPSSLWRGFGRELSSLNSVGVCVDTVKNRNLSHGFFMLFYSNLCTKEGIPHLSPQPSALTRWLKTAKWSLLLMHGDVCHQVIKEHHQPQEVSTYCMSLQWHTVLRTQLWE